MALEPPPGVLKTAPSFVPNFSIPLDVMIFVECRVKDCDSIEYSREAASTAIMF